MESCVQGLLRGLGEEPRPGIANTPKRYAKALRDITQGSRKTLDEVVGGAVFEEAYDQMIIVRDIEFFSMCEHHMLPFFGYAHIGYIPDGRVLGLSKLVRVVDLYTQRLSMQERLTREIGDGLHRTIKGAGVGVVVEGMHMCMAMRGVRRRSITTTSFLTGEFRDNPKTRTEFLSLVHGASPPGNKFFLGTRDASTMRVDLSTEEGGPGDERT
jgi:GTP cyclohydrolase I